MKVDLFVILQNVWYGFITRNQYQEPFLIHRPYSEIPGDAVSEGVGYGLILSYYNDDQTHFNKLLEGAEQTMWNGQYYDWRIGPSNEKIAFGSAVDAEQDIAFMLIKANERVMDGQWTDYKNGFYSKRAQIILNNLYTQGISSSKNVRAGYGWGGDDFVNVGYFAPSWYRVFSQFDIDLTHDWIAVIDQCYHVLRQSIGYSNGLVPDWMTPEGQFTNNLGYNAYGNGQYMYKDAIRTLWRIGSDYLWYKDPRALEFIENAYIFLKNNNGIKGANFFQSNGSLVPSEDIWIFDDGKKQRFRREHSPLTVGMWSIPIFICGTEEEKTTSMEHLKSFYENNQTFWGLTNNSQETIYNNEMYFEQFLASFGALILTNQWK